jgi:thiol-disulfide isomerase/thioredoxin
MRFLVCVSLVVTSSLCCEAQSVTGAGELKSPDQIVKELDSLKMPVQDLTRINDRQYFREFLAQGRLVIDKRSALILELYKVAPNVPRVWTFLPERWSAARLSDDASASALIGEIDDALERIPDQRLRVEGLYFRALAKLAKSRSKGTLDLSGVSEFLQVAPAGEKSKASRLFSVALRYAGDEKSQGALKRRIIDEFPETSFAVRLLGAQRRSSAIGQSIDLEFRDAISGAPVSLKSLRGKVVVMDFWATWCEPCISEMPKMKERYAKYHDRGVEFIGVSLDLPEKEGGRSALKKFVNEHQIPWFQYYQGNGWQSEFSTYWGIEEIPAVFVVDRSGRLYSVDARRKLDELVSELIKTNSYPLTEGSNAEKR